MDDAKGFTLIELMIVVVIIGILATISLPNYLAVKDRAREAGTKENAFTLQLAVEDFAVRNAGLYSDQQADVSGLLPADPNGGNNLQNTFSGLYTEPRWAQQAGAAGQIGLQVIQQGGLNVGYSVTGFGKDVNQGVNGIIITLTSGQ